ncbi:MAG TPA: hypothetical protein QF624_10495 [Dehalococcoidia bacterium]|nr:hypothetical protein [Dehalococcoidia bacterium]
MRYCVALEQQIEWRPDEPAFHLYRIEIVDVALVTRDESDQHVQLWRAND